MPNARFYVRNHFETPMLDPETWRLDAHGLVDRPLTLTLRDVQQLPSDTLVATLECAGNGRSLLDPPVDGEQWRLGAVSTAEWTGVPLVEVLDRVGAAACGENDRVPGRGCRRSRGVSGHPFRARSVSGRGAQLGGDPRLRDERRVFAHGTRLPAPADRARLVCGRLGQVAHGHRGDLDAVRRLLPDEPLRVRVGPRGRHDADRARPLATGARAHHRARGGRRARSRRYDRPRRRVVGRGSDLRCRDLYRRRTLASGAARR